MRAKRKPEAQVGIIRRIVREKGFGFLQALDGTDLFFHRTDLEPGQFEELLEGSRVRFVAVESPKGARAKQLSIIDEA